MMRIPELPAFDYQPRPYAGPHAEEVLRLRREFLNPGIFLYYKKPLMLVEGKGQYVFDETGRRYLDALGGIGFDGGHVVNPRVEIQNKQAAIGVSIRARAGDPEAPEEILGR